MPDAAPVIKAVLPALKTGWTGIVEGWVVGGGRMGLVCLVGIVQQQCQVEG